MSIYESAMSDNSGDFILTKLLVSVVSADVLGVLVKFIATARVGDLFDMWTPVTFMR